jgi:insulysin
VLLDLLLDSLAGFRVRPDRFAVMAEAAGREYANVAFQQVYQWAMYRAEVRGEGG